MSMIDQNIGTLQSYAVRGTSVYARDLQEMNKALRAATYGGLEKGTVNYPQQGVNYTGELAPLVPQSLQRTLDSATVMMRHVKFWPKLNQIPVWSPLHEADVIKEQGSMGLDPFIAEGGIGTQSEASFERLIVQIKYLAEYIELSDVATMVGTIGGSGTGLDRNMLNIRTLAGTTALLVKLERALFWARSDLSSLHFDGLRAQIVSRAPTNVHDARNTVQTPQDLAAKLAELIAPPYYGFPDVVMVDPRYHQALSNIAVSYGRHDQVLADRDQAPRVISFGAEEIYVAGPMGRVKIEPFPLIQQLQNPPSAAVGSAVPTLNTGMITGTVVAPTVSGSLWDSDWEGDYRYTLVAVGDMGHSAGVEIAAAASILANGSYQIDINDASAPTSGDNSIRYYRVYRSPKGGASGTQTFMWDFPRNTDGAASGTRITDLNRYLPNTSPVFLGQMTPDVLYWAKLLDFTRRPIAQLKTSIPFLLMLFGSLFVKVPSKWKVIDNVPLSL